MIIDSNSEWNKEFKQQKIIKHNEYGKQTEIKRSNDPNHNDWIDKIADAKYEDVDADATICYPGFLHDSEEHVTYNSCHWEMKNKSGALIQCIRCKRYQHQFCWNAVPTDNDNYVCLMCKFRLMDPYVVPIYCLLKPFEVPKTNSIARYTTDSKIFDVPDKLYHILKNNNPVK